MLENTTSTSEKPQLQSPTNTPRLYMPASHLSPSPALGFATGSEPRAPFDAGSLRFRCLGWGLPSGLPSLPTALLPLFPLFRSFGSFSNFLNSFLRFFSLLSSCPCLLFLLSPFIPGRPSLPFLSSSLDPFPAYFLRFISSPHHVGSPSFSSLMFPLFFSFFPNSFPRVSKTPYLFLQVICAVRSSETLGAQLSARRVRRGVMRQ